MVLLLLNRVISSNSLNRFHILAREDAPIFKLPTPKIEKQSDGRASGFEVVDDLRQFIIRQLVAERFDFHNNLLIGKQV